jgi:regulator of replication initiation timing
VNKNFISDFPWIDEMKNRMNGVPVPEYREVNGHIHTPYSFSAFERLETAFNMAKEEEIAVLGINDFFVADGFEAFKLGCLRNDIFPLFNIEFIGLLKKEQKKGIRINDPNNPGRIYFSGKGLDYPFNPGFTQKLMLNRAIRESQEQIKAMISKINGLIGEINPSLKITYEEVRDRFAEELVRERHLAKAIRILAAENYPESEEQLKFIESLYGGKKSKSGIQNPAALENEIRSNLLKAGGAAFVREEESSFIELKKLIKIIHEAGGIPCYPVLLDDPSGKFTEFEADKDKLLSSLSALGIGCIELIPGRNEFSRLKSFVEFFDKNGFVILFGTEHNTPEMVPLTITARGNETLDDSLKKIAWDGACVIAAHQYLRAHRRQGYVLSDGTLSNDQKQDLSKLGRLVIEYYLNRKQYEPGN